MNEQDITYALAKQVPAMESGFTVATSYGDIIISPGWIAKRMSEHLDRALRCELMVLQQGTKLSALETQLGFGG